MSVYAFRRIASDGEGYYYDRWDLAVPVSVEADTEAKARHEAARISGEPRRGWFWKFHLDRIEVTR